MKKSKYIFAGLTASLCLAIFCGAFFAATSMQTVAEPKGKVIIDAYMESKGWHYRPGTKEYSILMRGILEGNHDELTGGNSRFLKSEEDLSAVLAQAGEYYYWGLDRIIRKNLGWIDQDQERIHPVQEVDLDQP